MTDRRDRKIELAAALLQKAERTTEREAEALTEAAEKLILRYQIEQAELDQHRQTSSNTSEQIIEADYPITGAQYARARCNALAMVVSALGQCETYYQLRGRDNVLTIVGYESDVEQAMTLVKSIDLQAINAMRTWWETVRSQDLDMTLATQHERAEERRGFIFTFGFGAGERIHATRRSYLEDAAPGAALVLIDRKRLVTEWLDGTRNIKDDKRQIPGSAHAHAAGVRAGHNAATGEQPLTERTA